MELKDGVVAKWIRFDEGDWPKFEAMAERERAGLPIT